MPLRSARCEAPTENGHHTAQPAARAYSLARTLSSGASPSIRHRCPERQAEASPPILGLRSEAAHPPRGRRLEAFWRDVVRDMYEATSSEDLSRRMIEKGLWGRQEGSRPGSPAEQASKDQDHLGGAPIDINVSDIVEGHQPRFAGDRGVDNRGTSAPERSATDAAQGRPEPGHPGARGGEPSRPEDRATSQIGRAHV